MEMRMIFYFFYYFAWFLRVIACRTANSKHFPFLPFFSRFIKTECLYLIYLSILSIFRTKIRFDRNVFVYATCASHKKKSFVHGGNAIKLYTNTEYASIIDAEADKWWKTKSTKAEAGRCIAKWNFKSEREKLF